MGFQMDPFPIEKEFKVLSVKRRLKELSREELEEFLSESLLLLSKMAYQMTQLRDFVLEETEGKTE